MTKPSDFSPAEALEVRNSSDTWRTRRRRWLLSALGVAILVFGWLAVSLHDFGQPIFIADTVVFLAIALYGFTAAAASRRDAVEREKKLRLRLLVHNMELENISMRDELTQLFNRRYLMERLERELQTAKGFQRSLALIAIEVKSLNHINQTYGYAVGDRLLAACGRFLMDRTRVTDIPGRMSGNRFGVILPDTSKRGAHVMIDRLTRALATTPLMADLGQSSAIVVSFGMSGYPWSGDTPDGIVQQAEAEMVVQPDPSDIDSTAPGPDQGLADEIPAVFQKPGEAPGGS